MITNPRHNQTRQTHERSRLDLENFARRASWTPRARGTVKNGGLHNHASLRVIVSITVGRIASKARTAFRDAASFHRSFFSLSA